jgi:hypothetical protein
MREKHSKHQFVSYKILPIVVVLHRLENVFDRRQECWPVAGLLPQLLSIRESGVERNRACLSRDVVLFVCLLLHSSFYRETSLEMGMVTV